MARAVGFQVLPTRVRIPKQTISLMKLNTLDGKESHGLAHKINSSTKLLLMYDVSVIS